MIAYKSYHPVYLDADILLFQAQQARNEEHIWRWCRQYSVVSSAQQDDWAKKIHSDPTIKMFAVKNGEKQIGVCGFTSIDRHNRNAEFSLYIERAHQGFGAGGKALRTLVRHGFEDWGFKRIWGEVFEGNPAMRLFERIGFSPEGKLRATYWRKGKFINSTIISILDEEYVNEPCNLPT